MGKLSQFLTEQAERLKSEPPESVRRLEDWVGAIDRLRGQVLTWILESDPRRILDLEEKNYELRDQGIGKYVATGLLIVLGPRIVELVPISRNVASRPASIGAIREIRAYGRVDLTNGLQRYLIFRLETGPGERWGIVEENSLQMEPLTQDSFEAALQSLLE